MGAQQSYAQPVIPTKYSEPMTMCLCHGKTRYTNDHRHCVYIAFLEYINGEFEEPASIQDTLFPVNKIATILGQTQIIHCQMVFRDTNADTFYTWSVDSSRGVHVMAKKQFAKKGWRFLQIMITEEQEIAMHNFCTRHLGKPFAKWSILRLYFVPYDNEQKSWFCSQLCVEALRHAGIITTWTRPAYSIPPHELYEFLTTRFTEALVLNLDNNIVKSSAQRALQMSIN